MHPKKKTHPLEKTKLHPRNKHRERYDFKLLIENSPELTRFVKRNEYDDESIDFFDPEAVKSLNKALLKQYYGIDKWDIPQNYLCPPIPGRADYIHHIADLLYSKSTGKNTDGNKITCLDIGVGANCVYPIIGIKEYGWNFIGSDIDPDALENASRIIHANSFLKDKIDLRLQSNPNSIFSGIIQKNEFIDLSICNPPFHRSQEEAQASSSRKVSNLKRSHVTKPVLNFGGHNTELWCEGGEERFVRDMILQSKHYSKSCFWFSTLISKQGNLNSAYYTLEKAGVSEVKTILMGQGNKVSRVVAWTWLTLEEQQKWIDSRWHK